MSDVKLYGYCTSPFVRKVACFLYYKEIEFDFVPVNPVAPQATLGFTDGTQVPVLAIGDQWKRDSTPIGLWLDETYPQRPLLPADEERRAAILDIDRWVSDTFLTAIFRAAMEPSDTLAYKFRFWRLAALVSSQSPMPEEVRHNWPNFVPNAPFIKAMAEHVDLTEPADAMAARIAMELVGHLGDGPFLGGAAHPTLADLAVFPQIIFGYMAGLEDDLRAASVPPLRDWMKRVAGYLPENPILVRDDFLVRKLADASL